MSKPKPIGSLVGLTYDADRPVDEGDVIRTPTGRSYRVFRVRVQTTGKHRGRLHIMAIVIDPAEVTADDVVHPLHWYSRNRRSRPT